MKKGFLYYYLRSMRLYYCFVTGTTVLAGVMLAHTCFCQHVWTWRDAVVLTVGFLAWGVNQIFSDWCDRHEDRINAPHRPMVSGKLSPKPALALSATLMILFAAASYFVTPWALLFLAIGGGLNLCYSKLKRVPVLNCLIYAMAITCCAFYGFAGSCGKMYSDAWKALLMLTLLILPAHFLMCSFSYYKDKEGDEKSGISTLQTLFSDDVTLPLHWGISMVYTVGLGYFARIAKNLPLVLIFAMASVLIFNRLVYLLGKKKYHPATCWNCALCVWWLCFALLPFFPRAGLFGVFAVIMIFLLFRWYPDEKE